MNRRSQKIFIAILCVGIMLGLFRYQIALGWLLGCLIACITFKLTERFCDTALSIRNAGGTYGHFALNYGIWAIGLVIAAIYPNLFSVIACACGMVSIKLSIILDNAITIRTNKS